MHNVIFLKKSKKSKTEKLRQIHNNGVRCSSSPLDLQLSIHRPLCRSTIHRSHCQTSLPPLPNHITDTVRHDLSKRRPLVELSDRINYLTVITAVVGISLITNPFSLLTLVGLLAAWVFLYLFRPSDPPLVILGRTFSDRETLGLLSLLSIVVVFMTSVGSLLISAILVGAGIVCAHGAFRVPDDLFLDEPEPAATGFLSFLGGGSATGGVAGRV